MGEEAGQRRRPLLQVPGECLLVAPQPAALLARALTLLERNTDVPLTAELADLRDQFAALGAIWVRGRAEQAAIARVDASAQVLGGADVSQSGGDLINASEAAQLLGCTASNVRDLGYRDRLVVHKRGRGSWFDREDVLTYGRHSG